MTELLKLLSNIKAPSTKIRQAAWDHWDSRAKPLRSLGFLESAVVRLCASLGSLQPNIDRRALVVFCADNGIVAEGISQTDSSVTAIVAKNLCTGRASVCKMAALAHTQVFPVDVGMLKAVTHKKMRNFSFAAGTQNFAHTSAMSEKQGIQAINAGIQLAQELAQSGYNLLAAGEMGIGNTSSASAVCSAILAKDPALLTGRGAGLSKSAHKHKIQVIRQALIFHGLLSTAPAQTLDALFKVGGFDIAAMTGFYLGAALSGRPVVVDGFIASTAALIALNLCPKAAAYLIGSHISSEYGTLAVLEALQKIDTGFLPFISANMGLGEGTGAVAAIPLLDMALSVFSSIPSFADMHIRPYTAFSDEIKIELSRKDLV